jgi:hypothetical protein
MQCTSHVIDIYVYICTEQPFWEYSLCSRSQKGYLVQMNVREDLLQILVLAGQHQSDVKEMERGVAMHFREGGLRRGLSMPYSILN